MLPKTEYPRPQMVREEWLNLNGEWEFEIDIGESGKEQKFYQRDSLSWNILVPFVPESKLSGLEQTDFMKSVWYRRTFRLPENWHGGRILLHFGAVDYFSEVWVNGVSAGTHKGGYTPFVFDITPLLRQGENVLFVNALDDVRDRLQPTGKQCWEYHNMGCLYTRSTGIWQTVWLEHVPELYIRELRLTPDVDNARLLIEATLNRAADRETFDALAALDGSKAGGCSAAVSGNSLLAVLPLENLKLWNPGKPVLYDLDLKLGKDRIRSYFGMRKISLREGCVELNDTPVFQRLVLDQGYYPEGIYTAPSDEAIRQDIELSMSAGFNGARMHMKVFDPRYLYWADRLGYLVWGEYPNWGLDETDSRALLSMLPEWLDELERDYSHPSIVGWCPFNETSVKRNADVFKTVYRATRDIDRTRPVIDSSGYVHAVTDIYDVHDYEQNPEIFRGHYDALAGKGGDVFVNFPEAEKYEGQPYFVSEFGGIKWDTENDSESWGYGNAPKTLEEFYARYEGLTGALLDNPGICAFCYTQLTDVMQERNGIFTFNREQKFDLARIRAANLRKAAVE